MLRSPAPRLALAAAAGLAALSATTALAADGHRMLSSDNAAALMAPDAAASMQGFSGSAGRARAMAAGEVDDRLADQPSRRESAEEVWELMSRSYPEPAEQPAMKRNPGDAPDGSRSIIGADQRILINATTAYPYRAVVNIVFEGGRCTGFMINATTVATAGHCVYKPGVRFYSAASYRIYPGRNGASAPFGSCTAKRLHTVSAWATTGSASYDYGAIKLNCSIGNTVGWLGLSWHSNSLIGRPATIAGYPGDKPFTMWRSDDFVRSATTTRLFYANDTMGGQSGAPVWSVSPPGSATGCTGVCAIAIHAYGTNPAGGTTLNSGTRITPSVFNNLVAWRNAP